MDESDEDFSVKFELIYAMEMQRPIELSPVRGMSMKQVFDLVKTFAPEVALESPSSIEVYDGSTGRFSRTRILDGGGRRRIFTLSSRFSGC